MNIRNYWPLTAPSDCDAELWDSMLRMRLSTFQGFANIEEKHGFIRPTVSLATSHGQEVLRMLALRILEELGEAYLSVEPDHYYEELIDAFNYLLSMFLLSGEIPEQLASQISDFWHEVYPRPDIHPIDIEDLGHATVVLGAQLGDSLRNRAWMKQVQNSYLDLDLFEFMTPLFSLIFQLFPNFEQFWSYYVAKDAVLQFRLRSNY